MQGQDEQDLREELVRLRSQHRKLDEQIVAMEAAGPADQLMVKRLKKQKLLLKDRMTSVEDELTPDIIA